MLDEIHEFLTDRGWVKCDDSPTVHGYTGHCYEIGYFSICLYPWDMCVCLSIRYRGTTTKMLNNKFNNFSEFKIIYGKLLQHVMCSIADDYSSIKQIVEGV